jgi:hypothetical protein
MVAGVNNLPHKSFQADKPAYAISCFVNTFKGTHKYARYTGGNVNRNSKAGFV